jgi:hypothetical protein
MLLAHACASSTLSARIRERCAVLSGGYSGAACACSQPATVCCEQVQEYTSLLALSLLEREHECIGTPSHAWHRYELTAVGR